MGMVVASQKSTHKHSTIEVYKWNMLFERGNKRFMFSCLPKDFYCNCGRGGRHTLDAILEVFVWDLTMLFGGCRAASRHDNESWGSEDYLRSKDAGQTYGFHAILLQARGDWPW